MHHVVVVHHQHAQVAGSGLIGRSSSSGTTSRTLHSPPVAARTPRSAAALERLARRPAAGPCPVPPRGPPLAPSLRTSSTKAPSVWHTRTRTELGSACLSAFRSASRQHGLGERLDLLRHLHALLPVELERQVLVVAAEPGELLAQGRAGVERRRRQRPRERVAQVRERAVQLLGAAAARLLAQLVLRAEHERDAEQPLDHALVQLAREVDARLEQRARGPAGWSRCARWPPARRSCRASTGRAARRR